MTTNAEIVSRAFEAFNRNDREALAELFSADCVMDWSRSIGVQKGVYRGLDGVGEWRASMLDAFNEFTVTPVELIGSGDRIIVRTRVHGIGRGSGVAVEAAGATLVELEAGKVTRLTLFQDADEARRAR